ncbi:hypothetical protein TSUD_82520 [Trifolium subterraneum]|uniref:Reverse transcriptase domain-containing protein n=1 Tax=Trifolium subterraneum TaxID=3900 RepID=A0A2Z6M3J3_TRISU|nr:hypothetical protein TSUD_82520 [Trifolium subterraneum]
MSRIDRFLVSDGLISKHGISGQWIGDRDISDHCPIWLIVSNSNWGPKPFRSINGWLEHPEFLSFVETSWKSFEVQGKKAYVLKEKFKLLKECLRKWNKEVFGFLDLNIETTVKELNDIEACWMGVDEIKGFVKNFFENNFKERWENRPNLNGVPFSSLSETDNLLLLAPFSIDEVREVIWSSDGNTCPGPDGFNFNFLKACWEIIKGDIMEFLHEFHCNATLPKAITASFLALIPKKDHPQVLSDYRPICLVSSLYKILSKVLAGRLKKVLGKLISKVQSAFLPNRQILDAVLVINELIDLAKRRKDKCLLFKVDFERANDSVNWNFLDYMMGRMGFADQWRKWMRACIFQSSMSVLINGSPSEDFRVGKGLRQGDPLSPFLFLIVAEGFMGLMRNAVDSNLFHGYKVNFFKSKLYGINLDVSFLLAASSFLHCEVDSIPFHFLDILNETEATSAHEMQELLVQIQPNSNNSDRRKWKPHATGLFSVRSAYETQLNQTHEEFLETATVDALKELWANNVPSKVCIFGWAKDLSMDAFKLYSIGISSTTFPSFW